MTTLPSEHDEQVAVIKHLVLLRAKHPSLRWFAVPNGGQRSKATAAQLKAEGVVKGVPDLIIFLPDGQTLALELKARESGRASSEQVEWLAYLAARPGWCVYLCHGAQAAIVAIDGLVAT